ncbi:MAG: hypothetical protein NT140_08905 [Deltaproteobacteria bacterium]|nr:hypothetical protein [Deltaproteobacteria bacterium]
MKRFFEILLSLTAGVVMVIAFSNTASAFEIGARGYYWFPTLKTDMKVDASGTPGTEFNVKDDLGMGTKAYPAIEVFGGLGKQHVSLLYTQADYSGSSTLSSPINFDGTSFATGVAVESSLKIRMLDVAYKYDVIDTGNILAGFSISAIGKVKYIEADASLSGGGKQAENTLKAPIPMIGAAAHIGILANILEARAEVTGIAYSGNHLYEALADLSLTPFPFLDIHAGYKIIALRIDQSDTYFNGNIAGPYLALTVSF